MLAEPVIALVCANVPVLLSVNKELLTAVTHAQTAAAIGPCFELLARTPATHADR